MILVCWFVPKVCRFASNKRECILLNKYQTFENKNDTNSTLFHLQLNAHVEIRLGCIQILL